MASSQGNALSLIKAVLELVATRSTGVLDVRSDGLHTRIYFRYGQPLFAEDEALGETFGRLLMRQGVITNEEFVRVIDEMTRAAAGNNQLRFGEVAVALGVLRPEQVEKGLGEQVCGIIARALQREESQWSVDASPAAARPPRAFSLEINPTLLAAIRESPDTSMVASVVAARPDKFVVVAGPRPAGSARDEAGGPPDEAHAARMAAEQAFQRGFALLRQSETAAAAIDFRRAQTLQPESLEYALYATWAEALARSEIPGEADRQTLLEIAHRAKKRDPMFAFGSYVIGQVAMWAGDEATAKKWFYEALRLDPDSEAGKQVRILARRRPDAPAPAAEAPAEQAGSPEAAAAVSPPPPTSEPLATQNAPVRAPASGWPRRLLFGAALVGVAALVVVVARRSEPSAGPAPSAAPAPAVSVDAGQPAPAGRADGAVADGSSGDARSAAATEKPERPLGEKEGMVRLPPRALGHRIFVDDRHAKTQETPDGVAPLRLPCGPHVIKIGSGGAPESIDLPCRGEIQLQ